MPPLSHFRAFVTVLGKAGLCFDKTYIQSRTNFLHKSMNAEIENHIIVMLGVKPIGLVMTEKMLYIFFFLLTESREYSKFRKKLYHFRKGAELPESPILQKCLRDPTVSNRECWEITEYGISLTQKGRDKLKYLQRREGKIAEEFRRVYTAAGPLIIEYELERYIQFKHPNWCMNTLELYNQYMLAQGKQPATHLSESVLKMFQDADFINHLVKQTVLGSSLQVRKKLMKQ